MSTSILVIHCLSCGRDFETQDGGKYIKCVCKDCDFHSAELFKTIREKQQPTSLFCVNCGDPFLTVTAKENLCKFCRDLLEKDEEYAKRLSGRIILPPFGYRWKSDFVLHANDRREVGGVLLGMFGSNSEIKSKIKRSSLRDMIRELRQNGFRVVFERCLRRLNTATS